MPRRNLITLAEVAERYHVSERTVRNWIATGDLTGYRLPGGRLLRVDADELDRATEPIPAGWVAPGPRSTR